MSNSVFQSVIVQLKDVSDRTFGVIDTEGCVVSCTDVSLLGERWPDAALRIGGGVDGITVFAQKCFKAIPARLEPLGPGESRITVCEGKYHQVRRMMASRGLTVIYLERIREGTLTLEGQIGRASCRERV